MLVDVCAGGFHHIGDIAFEQVRGLGAQVFHQAMVVMAWDAEWRQAHMRFGGNPVHTTVFEVDGTRIGKFKQKEGETLYYYHHSLLGVAVRGQPHLWWLLDMGLTRSADRGRVPPEDKDLWRRVMDVIFEDGDNLIQMSDSAAAFLQNHKAVIERYHVNHSIKEWTKHVCPIWNVQTGERRACLCSTNFEDSQWQKAKADIPKGIKSSTAGARRTKMLYIRAHQWKTIVQAEDRWGAFCAATKRWRVQRGCTSPHPPPPAANEGGGVAFGFDDTGEVGVLRNEEAIRKKWRGERDPCGPLLAGTVWVVSNHVE